MDIRDAKTTVVKSYDESDALKSKNLDVDAPSYAWWKEKEEDDVGRAFVNYANSLKTQSETRTMADIRHARLYENSDLHTLGARDFAASVVRHSLLTAGLVSFNIIASCVDTLLAKVAKNKPVARFLTSGAQWKMQIRTRRLDKWVRGLFWAMNAYETAKQVLMDAFVFGTGFLYVWMDADKKLKCERVMPSEIFCDDEDGRYGCPRQLLRRKVVSKDELISMFPDCVEKIAMAGTTEDSRAGNTVLRPMVEVWEGWYLPTGEQKGKHVIAISNCTLFVEEWRLDRLPFVVFRYKRRTIGFWGKGLAEALTGIQLELNRLVQSISDQLRRKGRGRIFVEIGSKVNPESLSNRVAEIVHYQGRPPIIDAGNVISADEFAQVDRLKQAAFQEAGISELSAWAKKPSGLDAAVALREFSDIESERFAMTHQAWDNFFMELAELCIGLVRDQHRVKSYTVQMFGNRTTKLFDWKDINLDRDSYFIQMFPSSALPQYPAARYAQVKEFLQDGFIQKPEAQRLLGFPDIEAEANLGNAAIDDCDAVISAILEDDEPKLMPPEPYQNQELLLSRAQAAYLFARHFPDIEEERLQMMRDLIDLTAANLMATQAAATPAPAPAPMPAMPPGAAPTNIDINAAAPVAPAVPPVIAQQN